LLAFSSAAQQYEASLSLHGFVDNREYAKSHRYSQTIFGSRISPEIGLLLDSTHRIRIGFNALNEFGSQSKSFFNEIKPVIYYQYQKQQWDFFIGSFPRVNLLDDYPVALLNDTLQYYRPNVEGMLAKYETENFKQTIWIDWTSRQTDIDRETFLFGLSGKYKVNRFFVSHYAYMFHNAGAKIEVPGDNLQDNGVALIQIGLDLSKFSFLDSLTLTGGGIMSFERTRNLTDWNTPKGFITDVYAAYRRFSIKNTFYAGDGHHLIQGDKFYTAKSYDRLDIGWTPILFKNIEGKFTFTFHFVENVIDNQQAFSLRYFIGKKGNFKN
jgi:hypothetical protein